MMNKKLNKAALIELRDAIIEHKEHFYWGAFLSTNNPDAVIRHSDLLKPYSPDCATIGCIAGFARALWGRGIVAEPLREVCNLNESQYFALVYANEYTNENGSQVFEDFSWEANTEEQQYEEAIRRLNYFIENEAE